VRPPDNETELNFSPDVVFARRQRYWANGYRPLEVWNPDQQVNDKGEPLNSPGKQPRGRWRERAAKDPPEAVRIRPDRRALNTGVLCGLVVAPDIDVPRQELADRIVYLFEERCGLTPLVRIGKLPKILLCYKAERPFSKIQTPELYLPDGTMVKVEVLAQGQQFVADGVHPQTRQPYCWTNGSPETVPIGELPVVTEDQVRAAVAEAERILRGAGAKPKEKRKGEHGPGKANGDFFEQVKRAALANIAAWVCDLLPGAKFQPGTGAWRVSAGGGDPPADRRAAGRAGSRRAVFHGDAVRVRARRASGQRGAGQRSHPRIACVLEQLMRRDQNSQLRASRKCQKFHIRHSQRPTHLRIGISDIYAALAEAKRGGIDNSASIRSEARLSELPSSKDHIFESDRRNGSKVFSR